MRTLSRAFIEQNSEAVIRSLIKKSISGVAESVVLDEFIAHLNTLERIDASFESANAYKSNLVAANVKTPSTILDIGAGNGQILYDLKTHFNLPTENVYALDLQPIERDGISVISYTPDMKIPLPNKSVSLVVMLSLLHHIAPADRIKLLTEVDRVLAANGQIAIREHDDNKSPMFRIYIQFIHYIWYVYNSEPYDPLHMMTQNELKKLFNNYGWIPTKMNIQLHKNSQNLYMQVFKRRYS